MTGSSEETRALESFHELYQADLASGRLRPAAEYLARFGGHEDLIRRELSMLEGRTRTAPRDGGPAPERLAHYRLLERLGAGGQGEVFLAHDEHLERRVALKILHDRSPGSMHRFVREAQAASRLDSPWICTVFDSGAVGDRSYIAMRYVPGRSLADHLREQRERQPEPVAVLSLPAAGDTTGVTPASGPRRELDRLLLFLEKCARALHLAHEAGLIHRDVKPGNILVGENGEPVLLDFGLARDVDGDGRGYSQSAAMGTPEYMSPEQLDPRRMASGTGHLDRRTDVYSLGLVLYECLTFERPFGGVDWRERYTRIMEQDLPDPTRVHRWLPSEVSIVLRKAVQKHPDDRYATALELADDLHRIRTHEPIRARPVGPMTRMRKWVRRNPAPTALLGVLVLVAVALLVVNRELHRSGEAERRAARRAVEARQALAESVAARRFADGLFRAGTGDWRGALAAYRDAAETGTVDARALAVARADAHIGLFEYDAARALLRGFAAAEAAAGADAGRSGPHVGRAVLLLAEIDPRERLSRARLDRLERDGAIAAADLYYGRSLLDRTGPAMLEHLDSALRADPSHRRARRLRALGLAICGRLRASEVQAEAYLQIFPRDPVAILSRAWTACARRDLRGADAILDRHGAALPERARRWLRDQLGGMIGGTRLVDAGFAQLAGARGSAPPRAAGGAEPAVAAVEASAGRGAATAPLGETVASFRLPRAFEALLQCTRAAVAADPVAPLALNAASRGLRVGPEPLLFLLRGRARRKLGRSAAALDDLARAWSADSALCGAGARLLAFAELAAVHARPELAPALHARAAAEAYGCARLLLDRYELPASWSDRIAQLANDAQLPEVAAMVSRRADRR